MSRFSVQIAWEDVPHLDKATTDSIKAAYLPHEAEARSKGVPSLGAGAIFPIAESDVLCEPFEFPLWYKHCYALDVGWNRTACLWGATDPETDICYLYSEYYRGNAEPPIHAEAIKSRGTWIPGVIDPAARGRSQKDGEQLLLIYNALLPLLSTADNAVEAGLYKVWTRLSTGKLKVFRTLQNWLAEFRIYRRDEKGKVVKVNDHLMDTTRYLCASGISLATQKPAGLWGAGHRPFAGLPTLSGRSQHQSEYQPMSEAWNPQPRNAPQGQQPREPWIPHRS